MSNLKNPPVPGLRILQSGTAAWFFERERVANETTIRYLFISSKIFFKKQGESM